MRRILVLALSVASGCAQGLVAPGADFRVVAPSTELTLGGDLPLSALSGDRILLPGAVEWLSRDPSTVTVRDGVAHGVFPGVAWVLAVRRNAVDSIRLTVRFDDLALGEAGIRSGNELLRLTGRSILTQNTTKPSEFHTAILASSGGIEENANGVCCRFVGDTIIQLNYAGRPVVGSRTLSLADVHIQQRESTEFLYHGGPDDLLLMVKQDGFHMRFYFPVRPAEMDLLQVVEPTLETPGRVRGRLSFEAAGILETNHGTGRFSYAPIGDRTTRVYVEFDSPLYFREFTPPTVPPPG